jgi:hypothetical protein
LAAYESSSTQIILFGLDGGFLEIELVINICREEYFP